MKITEDFKIQKNKENKTLTNIRYDENGYAGATEDKTCAIVTMNGSNPIFKAKISKEFKLYNPLNKSNTYYLNAKDKRNTGNLFKLREVSQDVFNNYISFLQTKHDSFIILAERKLK